MERAMGFEPTTPTLARLCSTPELHPHHGIRRGSSGAGRIWRKELVNASRPTGPYAHPAELPQPCAGGPGWLSRARQNR
jgi:hypothetical protein